MKTLLSDETRSKIPSKLNGAFIFSGHRHIGKSTLAHELAEGSQITQIAPSKTSIGIESIQELSRSLSLKNHQNQVIIIEDAHTLTLEAQNAFLKTLEEVSSQAAIILVTNQISRLLPTIRSRCQTVIFTPLPDENIAEYIKNNYKLTEEKAGEIAAHAAGLLGLAVKFSESPEELERVKGIEKRLEGIFGGNLYERLIEIPKLVEELAQDNLTELVSAFVRKKLRESENSAYETWYYVLCRVEKSLRMQTANGNKKLINDNLILQG